MQWTDWRLVAIYLLASVPGCSSGTNYSGPNLDTQSGNAAITTRTDESNKSHNSNDVSVQLSPVSPAFNRQIIYNADVSVEVGDIDGLAEQLNARLKELEGFVSNFSEQRYAGDRRTATWTIRIDATKFLDLLKWLDDESNVLRKQVTSKDVTEEYVDLNARLTNKKVTEKRLTFLLEERSGKLEEVLAFEKEIDRTREEIERFEGRLRLLRDQIALSTIMLTAATRIDYLAPKPTNLATSISETWGQSVGKLQGFCTWLLIVFVGLVPWLPILAALVGLCWFAKATWSARTGQRLI